jgi:hypothetical protein
MSILSTSSGAVDNGVSITITRPAGAGASHFLACLLARQGSAGGIISAPTGWTRRIEIDAVNFTAQLAIYTAPGDVSALQFDVPSGNSSLRYGCVAFAGRSSAHEDSDIAESTTTTADIPALIATAGADGAFIWFNAQTVTAFGSVPGGLTDFFDEGTNNMRVVAAHAAAFSAGSQGPFSRTAPNFDCKLSAGILVPASGAVTVLMGTRIFVNA